MFENIEKAHTIMLLAIGVILEGEDEQVKKGNKRSVLDKTMVKNPKLKHSSSSQLLFKDFPKIFSECAMFIRDRRNTNLTKNIVMAAPVTMDSTLDNAGVLDPLLGFIFKN